MHIHAKCLVLHDKATYACISGQIHTHYIQNILRQIKESSGLTPQVLLMTDYTSHLFSSLSLQSSLEITVMLTTIKDI